MLIQRRPSASMISWRGASGSGGAATACPRTRAARPKRGFGRLGIRTERGVRGRRGQIRRHRGPLIPPPGDRLIPCKAHSWTHPEGWRDWPDETPATPATYATSREGANSCEMWQRKWTFATTNGGGFFVMAAESLKCRECAECYPLDARYVCERCFG